MRHDQNAKLVGHTLPAHPLGFMNGGPVTSMKAKNAATPLCYVLNNENEPIGHSWENTTSPGARVCSRCRLVQYKTKKGHWKNAASLKSARAMKKRAEQVADLWSKLDDNNQNYEGW